MLSLERLEDRCCPSTASDLVAANIVAYNNGNNGAAQMASIQEVGVEQRNALVSLTVAQNIPQNIIQQQIAVNQNVSSELTSAAQNNGRANAQQFIASVWLQSYRESTTPDGQLFAAQQFADAVQLETNYRQNAQSFIWDALNDLSQNVTVMSYYNSP